MSSGQASRYSYIVKDNITGPFSFQNNGPITLNVHRTLEEKRRDLRDALLFKIGPPPNDKRIASGTCKWIVDDKHFQLWLTSENQHALWICGGPGKGKTFLSSYLIDELPGILRTLGQSDNPLVLKFFCDNRDGLRNTALVVLLSLLHQLLESDKSNTSLHNDVSSLLQDPHTDLFSKTPRQDLWDIFKNKASPLPCGLENGNIQRRMYLLLDGLDECDGESIQFLRENLKTMCLGDRQKGRPTFKAIIVSRPLVRGLETQLKIDLDEGEYSGKTLKDIRGFIRWKVENSEQMKLEGSKLASFERNLSERADGTFLWVALAMNILEGDSKMVTKIVSSDLGFLDTLLPRGLYPLYNRMLLNTLEGKRTGGKHFRQQDVAKIIRCVSMAFHPLTESELQIATGLDPSDVSAHIDNCRHILSYRRDGDSGDRRLQLVHLSLKEYLQHIPYFTLPADVGNLFRHFLSPAVD
ncbi:hypothetical protein F5884DRAFT_151539 [Xylogone sp. PMI_703]|nr:hypothetical protein F5884DRAFT_151539 [Xylogone sp. PMI_703]